MKKQLIAAAAACGVLGLAGAGPALAKPNGTHEPKGNAYGYWAGRLCDHVGSTTDGVTYWEDRGYESREACVEAEGESLRLGEWDPDAWPEI